MIFFMVSKTTMKFKAAVEMIDSLAMLDTIYCLPSKKAALL